MCSYADEREQTSILITFSTVSIGTTRISLPFEMFTRLLQLLSGKSAIGDPSAFVLRRRAHVRN